MADAGVQVERVLGVRRGPRPGPTLIVVGGIHGNEPAGVLAARRVLAQLDSDAVTLSGELVALSGNVGALALGQRYRQKDLNRQWTQERIHAVLRCSDPGALDAEDQELKALHDAIAQAMARARGPIYLLDLHTTSADGFPFALYGDTLRHSAFASRLPVPAILGLEEQVDGVLVEWYSQCGLTTLVVEAGRHDAPSSVERLIAVLWLALAAAGLADAPQLRALPAARALLQQARGALPPVMEVLLRHPITAEQEFRMEPGFANIAPVARGQLLARDRHGPIRSPRSGWLFLPLYQRQGQDGFFLGRAVGPWRQRLSRLARQYRLDVLLPLLPGVQRDPAWPDMLHVDTRIAHFYPLDVFHLFGFRKQRQTGAYLQVTRRPH